MDIAYPGEDGQLHTTTAKEGDFFVQNGAFHEFHNRSDDPCVILMLFSRREEGGLTTV